MALFSEAFIFRASQADPTERGTRDTELAHTVFVPATDAETAATVAAELLAGGLDLIELYGFGPRAAARVLEATGGTVPVGVVGVEETEAVRNRAVITPAPGADPATDRYVHERAGHRMTIVSVPDPEAVPAVARQLTDEGVQRIDMCGGLGPVPAAAAIEAVGDRATVGAVMFGFESLPGVAAYRERFEKALSE